MHFSPGPGEVVYAFRGAFNFILKHENIIHPFVIASGKNSLMSLTNSQLKGLIIC